MNTKINLFFIVVIFFTTNLFSQGNLPESREATFIEANGSTEILVRATGIGGESGFWGFKEEKSLKLAEIDARKSAVYFVLYGGANLDGVLRSEEDKRNFSRIENDFFAEDNIKKFIAWEATTFEKRVRLSGKDKLKIEKQIRINKKTIVDQLIEKRIIVSVEEITEEIGLPTIMVLPEVKTGENPLDELRGNTVAKQGASTIESYLTAKKYNVIAPDQAEQISQQQKAQISLKGNEEDLSYTIALSVGSDIYITYALTIDERKVGSTKVRKASASVRAYETTTARLLGTETGYSEESAAPAAALVESAIANALNNVLGRVNSYWEDDIKNGAQYKVIFTLNGNFDEDAKYDVADAVEKSLKKLSNKTKENIVSDKTIDYLVWISNKEMQSPTGFFRVLRKEFSANYPSAKLKQITLNRKLMLLGIE